MHTATTSQTQTVPTGKETKGATQGQTPMLLLSSEHPVRVSHSSLKKET